MLDSQQRELVRRMRKALAPLPEPARRELVTLMREMWQKVTSPLLVDLERRRVYEEAVALALEERLGHEPEEGEPITHADELRAEQILADCWGRFD
jgi:hypothetical protein